MKFPEASGVIPLKVRGIHRVVGIMMRRWTSNGWELEPMIQVVFKSGKMSAPMPMISTMAAILDLKYDFDPVGAAIIRDSLGTTKNAR